MAMFVVRVLRVCVFDINSLGNEIGIDSVFGILDVYRSRS